MSCRNRILGGLVFLAVASCTICASPGSRKCASPHGILGRLMATTSNRSPPMHMTSASVEAAAIADADGVVNAISLYVEHGRETFHSVHVEAATRIASIARRVGAKRLVHISGIGADVTSPSPYIRSRGEGEAAVQTAFPGVVIIRPAVMFAPDDGFLTTILRLLRILPAYPLFGDGRTRLQPAYADDVAEAITQVLRQSKKPFPIYELAGPRVYSYEELVRTIARAAGLRPVLMRTPFAFWTAVAGLAENLPRPPLTRNQVELMQIDAAASNNLSGFSRARNFTAIA